MLTHEPGEHQTPPRRRRWSSDHWALLLALIRLLIWFASGDE